MNTFRVFGGIVTFKPYNSKDIHKKMILLQCFEKLLRPAIRFWNKK